MIGCYVVFVTASDHEHAAKCEVILVGCVKCEADAGEEIVALTSVFRLVCLIGIGVIVRLFAPRTSRFFSVSVTNVEISVDE